MKIKNYKGSVAYKWKYPQNKEESIKLVINFMRFWGNVKKNKIFFPPLIENIKKVAEKLREKVAEDTKFVPLLMTTSLAPILNEIRQFKLDATMDYVLEKVRKRRSEYCVLCRVRLVYPAYIVSRRPHRLDSDDVSKPIGIRCLNHSVGRLGDLIREFETEGGMSTSRSFSEYDSQQLALGI